MQDFLRARREANNLRQDCKGQSPETRPWRNGASLLLQSKLSTTRESRDHADLPQVQKDDQRPEVFEAPEAVRDHPQEQEQSPGPPRQLLDEDLTL